MQNNILYAGLIQVTLVKQPLDDLGFYLHSDKNNSHLVISGLVRGGSAEKSGLVQTGDVLVKVNDISLQGKSFEEAAIILRSIPVLSQVVLLLRCQDGYTAHLETHFGEDGKPKTVRITKSINPPETFMSKIKRTLCSSHKVSDAREDNDEMIEAHSRTDAHKRHLHRHTNDNHGYVDDNGDDKTKLLESDGGHFPDLPKDRRGLYTSANAPQKAVKLINTANERPAYMDTLHMKALEDICCTAERCIGSMMIAPLNRPPRTSRPKKELIYQAKDFIDQYYANFKRQDKNAHEKRWADVLNAIENNGTYDLTADELTFGAKTAWRNAPRCIGRIQWSKLQLFDARHVTTARGMFEAICNHIKYGTNDGNIRSAITIFPHRISGKRSFRVWNSQLFSYAGYKQSDGTVIGDPIHVEFTEVCQKLGWKGKNGRFDILPLVLQANEHDPEFFDIPPELVLEVEIKHPKFPWFTDLGLKWYTLPAVSNMMFDCGGLEFTAAPFNGWYMSTEVGARDLCDPNRYNILETVAQKMQLDTKKNSSLWKDIALVEINVAVLYSYQSKGVTIMDHHTAAESFMSHLENEQRLRGGCPSDWVWIVPPMSGSLTPVFRQEMLNYKLKPSYEYQNAPWKTHVWKKDKDALHIVDKPRRKIKFRHLGHAVQLSVHFMRKALAGRVKCTILYATETGKSEGFAKTLCQIFKHAFNAKVLSMDEYDCFDLEHESLLLIVTSTFGNGDPPENGQAFAKTLLEMKHPERQHSDKGERLPSIHTKQSVLKGQESSSYRKNEELKKRKNNMAIEKESLRNVRYSVFGLGSSAYPKLCAFGHYLDNILHDLGGMRILEMGEGDEEHGQKESFRAWAQDIFKSACEAFGAGDEKTIREAVGSFSQTDLTWSPEKFRLTSSEEMPADICEGLSKLHGRTVVSCRLIERTQLQSLDSSRQTLLVRLNTQGASELIYSPGDHLAVFAENSPALVDGILTRLHHSPPLDQTFKIEMQSERATPLGNMKTWERFPKFPTCTMRTALSRYLDITTPPTRSFLKILATQASDHRHKEGLENLANNLERYEDWKHSKRPNLLEVLDEFPSLQIPAALILTQLPLLQQRYYSISSSGTVYPGEIHATIAVVKYRSQGGKGSLHEGVCSSWLNRIASGTIVPCFVRIAPSFHLPMDKTIPIIMVGPGTGIAPLRSFWQQRKIDRKLLPMYVQDYLIQNSTEVYNIMVREGGHFYVCGDAEMAKDVTSTLEKILQKEGNMRVEDATNFILKLKDSNQFHEDIFWNDFKELRGNRQDRLASEEALKAHQSQGRT
ncbi:hypothetical protein ACJMK2_040440 [Sinanodonta woodiana]|uniref:Nitric oxide synthase n=1 Tax=Sinanodonta woodiana TaxID=1069815 RepID=A0ABD3W483_SINWO